MSAVSGPPEGYREADDRQRDTQPDADHIGAPHTLHGVGLTDLAISGPLLLAVLVSVLAGAVSFASPCVVPLVPGYLAFLAGLVGAEATPI